MKWPPSPTKRDPSASSLRYQLSFASGPALTRYLVEAAAAVLRLQARYPQQRAIGTVLAVDVERWSGWAAQP